MRSISLLVNDNLKSPPPALLQPRASLKAKGNDTLEIVYTGLRNHFPTIHCEGRPSARSVSKTICERTREKMSDFGYCTTRWTKQSKSECSVVQLGHCADFIEANKEVASKKIRDLHKSIFSVKETSVQACVNILPTSHQDNSREGCRISVRK